MEKVHTQAAVTFAMLLACCACSLALDPSLDISQYAHRPWTVRDGFFKGEINAIAQTPDGYLWLGTEFGLLRFDGVRAVPWQPPSNQHLPSTVIFSLLTTPDRTLWIGTEKGLASWKDGQLKTVGELSEQAVMSLLQDRAGTVWVGTFAVPHGKLCAIRNSGTVCYGEDGGLGDGVYVLYEDTRNTLWAGVRTGLWRWEPGPRKFYQFVEPEGIRALGEDDNGRLLIGVGGGIAPLQNGKRAAYPLPSKLPRFKAHIPMLRDGSGSLWIGTADRGIVHIHQGRTDLYTQADGLSGDYVNTIFEDREGNIWVGTRNGLDRLRDFAATTISVRQGLSNNLITAVLASTDGSVWIASALGGLNRWNQGQIETFGEPAPSGSDFGKSSEAISQEGKLDQAPNSLFEDHRGRIWVSTLKGVNYLEGKRFIPIAGVPGGRVPAMAEDSNGDLWIANQDSGLLELSGGKMVQQIRWNSLGHKDPAMAMARDPTRSGLWLGFRDGGVAYFNDGQVRTAYGVADGVASGQITGLQLDKDGMLWVTAAGGMSRLKNGHFATLSSKNGLPCDMVHGAMHDDDRSLWLYMACGLLRISASELDRWFVAADEGNDAKLTIRATVFDFSDGVRSHATLNFYTPQVARSLDGRLWFLPTDGVSVLDPHRLPENRLPPPVHIEQIIADGKTYDSVSGLGLPPHVRDLTIDYTALTFVAATKVRFRYKLEGQDRDWREVVNDREVQYSNLAPGNYRFRVTACNNSGLWNEQGDAMDFSIAPAYYQTNWFRALCAAAFLALLWGLYQIRIRQLRQQEEKFREAIETIPAMAFISGSEGYRLFVNQRWVEYTGLDVEQVWGKGWQAALHQDDRSRALDKWWAARASGEPLEYEARFRRAADGEYRWFLVRAVPMRDKSGKVVKWCSVATDIEDRKRAEQLQSDLAHTNRVTMLGELAASISHELKQPITATMTNARTSLRWLKREYPNLQEVCEAIERIVQDGARATEIIDRLRSLYKKTPSQRELVDVNEIIREMVVLLRVEATRHAVSMRADLATELPKITADRVQLQQVLMNLMLNGIEAMKDTGGMLTVKSQLEDGRLLVSVSDTGVGLPAENADQIFNAFFTTKPQGSGMGLSISRSIVESHGGRLWATANDGRGATFHFTLPTAVEVLQAPATGT